jgi:hypothetical protein
MTAPIVGYGECKECGTRVAHRKGLPETKFCAQKCSDLNWFRRNKDRENEKQKKYRREIAIYRLAIAALEARRLGIL